MYFLNNFRWFVVTILIIALSCAPRLVKEKAKYDYTKMDKSTVNAHKKIEKFLNACVQTKIPVPLSPFVRIDSLKIDKTQKIVQVYFSRPFSFPAYRENDVKVVYQAIRKELGGKYKKYDVKVITLNQPLEQLVPNYFRGDSTSYDLTRMPKLPRKMPAPLIQRLSRPFQPGEGLLNRVIDVRPSHGWYYNSQTERWEWQRPRMFQSVEDLLPFSFVVPYLIPMLENAGAVVFMPRERDIQTHEIVIDEDASGAVKEMQMIHNIEYSVKMVSDSVSGAESIYRETYNDTSHAWKTGKSAGFLPGQQPYPLNYNPFRHGSYRTTKTDSAVSSQATYSPFIPEIGDYAVYVSYHSCEISATDAHYTIYHAGGQSEFRVNQQIGGGTWIYLGTFKFQQGLHPESGQLILANDSKTPGTILSTDAVRFGGGMGDVQRNGDPSGRPRFTEGSKYYLQYAGYPDTLIYNLNNNKDDYKDDYISRSEYLNYLYGAPFGPKKNRIIKGLGIPFDLSLSFHTDAGITHNDTTIGTLAIYSVQSSDSLFVFPDSMSRMANRDLADILQTQIVDDLRRLYDPIWNRRYVMDGQYSEAVRPNVPTTLLELVSHQNFLDMKFALDPRFRFDTARAMYKGILKYIAFQNRSPFVVQPLPVDHFQALFTGRAIVTLKWQPRFDPLESNSQPQKFIVYTRRDDGGFDNGQVVSAANATFFDLQPGVVYSYKVTAVNEGGESFPSEILSVCWQERGDPVLIVNAFDRISAPAWINGQNFSGFADFLDQGVPDHYTFSYTGRQIDFSPTSPFRNNDAPGHGASQGEFETYVIAGNTFDYPYAHGVSIANAGFAFVSCSDEAVGDSMVDVTQFKYLDIILGEEKETVWPSAAGDSLHGLSFKALPSSLQKQIEKYLLANGGLFISGSYVGSDLCANKKSEHPDVAFAVKSLRFAWTADHACANGMVVATSTGFLPKGTSFAFNTKPNKYIYTVEAPDAIDPIMDSKAILRYQENQFGAGTAFKKNCAVVAFGFPFETILKQEDRDIVMKAVLQFLTPKAIE